MKIRAENGGTLVLALIALTSLALMGASALMRTGPRVRMAYQTAAWEEARMGAETGIDLALAELQRNTTGEAAGDWDGWQRTPEKSSGLLGGLLGGVVGNTLGVISEITTSLLGTVGVSEPIYLDNLTLTANGGVPTEADIQLWALYPASGAPWYRIRSMATCALPPAAYGVTEKFEAELRRFSLRTVRPQIRENDVGRPMTIPTPNVSRTVEVLAEPVLPFELALWTSGEMSLGTRGSWRIDSYDSRDPAKSETGGAYPGPLRAGAQARIATTRSRPPDSPYGFLIETNGTPVRGTIATNGGDDPMTEIRENVAGTSQLDPAQVSDTFCREMPPVNRPRKGTNRIALAGMAFVAGEAKEPAHYLVGQSLGAFEVLPPPGGGEGAIVISVNGKLEVKGEIVIPPGVTAVLYVKGDIDFHGSRINTGARSNGLPARLQIFGEDSGKETRTLRAQEGALVSAAFYGPTFDVKLSGTVDWRGAIAARSFAMKGGGEGGLHYDEALAGFGPPIGYRVARYVEDVRR